VQSILSLNALLYQVNREQRKNTELELQLLNKHKNKQGWAVKEMKTYNVNKK
jgi:hypothetical protein